MTVYASSETKYTIHDLDEDTAEALYIILDKIGQVKDISREAFDLSVGHWNLINKLFAELGTVMKK